jgi:hypothetical protein
MSRRIISQKFLAQDASINMNLAPISGPTAKIDTYYDRLIKYIPADVVAGWITVKGLISTAVGVPEQKIYWICFVVGVFFTFFWIFKNTKVENHKPAWTQITISTIAFTIWVVATGAPFNLHPLYGSLLLLGYTIFVGWIEV